MLILAIDLGWSKSVFCQMDTTTGEVSFGTFATSAAALRDVCQRRRPDQVVVEICPLAGVVHDLGQELGLAVLVADTTQDAWRWKNVKRKTDRDDALKLARLAALGQLNPVHIPPPRIRQWRQLLSERATLVSETTRCKNRIRAVLRPQSLKLPAGKNGWTQAARVTLDAWARPLADCALEEAWRGVLHLELQRLDALAALRIELDAKLDAVAEDDARVALLQTIPGVGCRTAEVLVATLDDPHRFGSRRPVAAYAGLTPRRYQSGAMDRSGRISKRGNRLLRQVLNQASWVAIRFDPELRALYLRVSGGGAKGRRKIAIVAVMHKLLVIAWAMLRDEQRYRPRRSAA